MNFGLHKVVFSKSRNAYVVVSENASCPNSSGSNSGGAATKGSVRRGLKAISCGVSLSFALVMSAWAAPAAPAANALPTGAAVAQGKVSVSQSGNTMTITQSTERAVVNFQSFDIGANAKVNIVQPSANSVQLDRVTGNNPSQIMGQLHSNGQVVLVNPNGIVVGQDGSVSASAFTASTLGITDADFMAGKNNFTGSGSNGSVVNHGHIKTKEGNYVALLGASVTNDGKISAPGGSVYMGAAKSIAVPVTRSGKIKLELSADAVNAAVTNTANGSIQAAGGQVYIQAGALNDAAAVSVSGSIDVSSNAKNPQGGTVTILADAGQIDVSATIKANSADPKKAGGDIIIGRDVQTGMLAAKTDVSKATLEAKGGLVETSAHYLKSDGVKVKAATWLIDPNDVEINETGVALVEGNTVVTVQSINDALSSGAQVIITTGTGVGSTSSVTIIPATGGTGTTSAIPVGTLSGGTASTAGNTGTSTAANTSGSASTTNTTTGTSGSSAVAGAAATSSVTTSTTATGTTATNTTVSTTATNTSSGTTASGAVTGSTATGSTTAPSVAVTSTATTSAATTSPATTAAVVTAPVTVIAPVTAPATAPAVVAVPTPVIAPIITPVAKQTIGNISINADISKISGGLSSITFIANNSVVVAANQTIASTSGALNVALTANAGNTGSGAVVLNTGASIASNGGSVSMTSSAAPTGGAGVQIAPGSSVTTSGGQVTLTAPSINVAGTIDTSAAKAGAVTVLADAGQIVVSGAIKANSTGVNAAPASIIIGRNEQTGVLAARTDVSGADLQAKGGLIETSGDFLKSDGAKIAAGTWLLDPVNVEINATSTAGTAGNSVVLASDISNTLSAGTSVTIATGTGTSSTSSATGVSLATVGATQGNGNIYVNETITKSGGVDASLSLIASGNITIAASKSITSTVGKLTVLLNANSAGTGGGIVFNSSSAITSNGGNITLGGGAALTGAGFATADGVSTLQGIYLSSTTISAGGGNIVMNGKSAVTNYQGSLSNIAGIYMTGGSISTTGSGTINLTAENQNTDSLSNAFVLASGTITGGSSGAVTISADSRTVTSSTFTNVRGALISGTVTSTGGSVSITGYGGAGTQYDDGVDIGGSVIAVGSGTLSITGTAGAGGSGGNVGVMTSGTATISSVDGAISITGTGGIGNGSQIRDHGVAISSSNAVRSTGAGNITITGTATNTDNGYSQGVVISAGGLNTNTGNIKIDSTVPQSYQVASSINAAVTATTGNVYIRSAGGAISNSTTGTISGNNVSIDNTGGTIDANGVITKGAGGASTWSGVISQIGINIGGSITASNNLNIYGNQTGSDVGVNMSGAAVTVSGKNVTLYGNSSSGNGVKQVLSTLSGAYLNVTGSSATGYNGFAWSGGTIKTTATGGTSTVSTVTGISAASTTASNGYGAFMVYANGAVSAVTGTSLSLIGQATTLTTGINTKERGILVQGGYVLTASGDITLDGSSKSSEGIAFGGTINMTTVAGVTNKLTIKGTAAASSNASLNAVNLSGAINGNTTTSSINIIGDAKNLSGGSTDNAVNISGAITGSTANVNVQSTGGQIITTAAITGNNISFDNSNGTINASTGVITSSTGTAGGVTAISIGGNVTATGNLNIYGVSNSGIGINVVAAKSLSGANIQATGKTTNGADGVLFNGTNTVTTTGSSGDSLIKGINTAGGTNALFSWSGLSLNAATGSTLTLWGDGTNTSDRAARFDGGGTTTGAVTLKGNSNTSEGLILINGAITESANSALTLIGTTTAAGKIGVYSVNSGGVVLNNGSTLNITGQSTNASGTSTGVAIGGSGIAKAAGATSAGNVTILGTTSSTSGSTGVNVASNITTDGTISITGTVASTNTGVKIGAAIASTTNTGSSSAINIQSNGNIGFDSGSITSSGSGGITVTAGDGTATSSATFVAASGATITQSGTGNVTISTSGLGDLTSAKIVDNGTGNVILAAGSAIAAGTATGGQVLTTHAANTITLTGADKLLVYSGAISGLATNTGNLSVLNSGFNNLSLAGSGITVNAQLNTAYGAGTTIAGGSNTQVLFRANTLPPAFSISLNNINKVYGSSDLAGAALITALGTAYSGASGTTTLTSAAGNNTFAMSAATAIAGLDVSAATRAVGEIVNGGLAYAYSGISGAAENVSVALQPGLVITPKALTVTATAITGATYDGVSTYQTLAGNAGFTTSGLVNANVDGTAIADTVTGVTSLFMSGLTIGSGSTLTGIAQAGSFNQNISAAQGTGLANYTISYVGNTGSVAKANLSAVGTQVYNGTTTFLGASFTGITGVNGETFTASGNGVLGSPNVQTNQALSGLGTLSLTGTGAAVLTNYNALSTSQTSVSVTQATAKIVAGKTYDSTTSLTNGQVAITGVTVAGSTEILGYTGTALANNANVSANSSNFVSGIALANGGSGPTTGLASNYVLPSLTTRSANNSVTIAAVTTAVTLTANSGISTYDGLSHTVSGFTAAGLVGTDATALVSTVMSGYTASGATATNAGTYNNILSGSNTNANYNNVTLVNGSLIIDRATLNVSLQNTVTKQYDGTTAATLASNNYLITGWVNGESGTITKTSAAYASQNASANTNASRGVVTVNLQSSDYAANAGTTMLNYVMPTSATGNVGVITAAPLTITVADRTLFVTQDPAPINAPSCAPCITYSSFVNGETAANALSAIPTVIYSGALNPVAGPYNGAYQINATPTAVNGNYTISVVYGKLNVIPAGQLLITIPTSPNTVYGTVTTANAGATAQAVTAQYLSTAGGSVISSLAMQDMGSGNWKATDSTGTAVTFTLGVASPSVSGSGYLNIGNYSYSSSAIQPTSTPNFSGSAVSPGTLTITPLALSLNAGAVTKVYNGSPSLSNIALVPQGLKTGDTVVATASTGAFVSSNAGNNIAFTLNGLSMSGTDAQNYSLAVTSLNGLGTISQAPLTVSGITASNKIYDSTRNATVSTSGILLNGLVSGDNVTVTSTGLFGTKNVGAQQVTLTNIYGGTSLSNYAITDQLTAAASISPLALVVSGVTANNKTYDGTTAATLNTSGALLTGLVTGDQIVVSGTGVFSDPNVGTNKLVTLSLLTTGTDVGNYNITNQLTTRADIAAVVTPVVPIEPVNPVVPVTPVVPVKPIMPPAIPEVEINGSAISSLIISTFINPVAPIILPSTSTSNSRVVIATANSLFSLASINQNVCSEENPVACVCETQEDGVELCTFSDANESVQ